MITSEEIKRRLWNGANQLRGSMDASRYKDYMLGLMFYKFLSDKTLDAFKMTAGLKKSTEIEVLEEFKKAKESYGDRIIKTIQQRLGYYVLPEYLYQTWLLDIRSGDFEVQKVIDSLNNFERTIAISDDSNDFKGLFSNSTLDLTDTALGSNLNDRSKNIKALILLFADLNMVQLQKEDILGDAYEYLIGMFAMESGKKAGEFYTPKQVSEIMASIVSTTPDLGTIYDPTVGSGSLLLTVGKHLTKDVQKNLVYYGQEKNTATYNLVRMNLLLHDVRPSNMIVKNGDTLAQDWPEDPERPSEGVMFDAVVMNPPYSLKNWNSAGLKISDPRFSIAGVLPPDSKGDFAFLLHGLYHLNPKGAMAIVLPHGVLFRGGAEGEIRERLLEKNYIDTIIGLPSNLFTNTGIPVVILILKKDREIGAPVLIIDASKEFIKVGKQNVLQDKDISRIVDVYNEKKEVQGYSHLATREELIENQYNLNIPRYVEGLEKEIPQDVDAHLYGGIPISNLDRLHTIQNMAPDLLKNFTKEIRPGYIELTAPIEEITEAILNSKSVVDNTMQLEKEVEDYIEKYWNILKTINNETDTHVLMNTMLKEIKSLLNKYEFVDVYDGYQVVAEIWHNSLTYDSEIIANSEFYEAGRTKVPNMVTKGSGDKKREEQDGWEGSIVPTELIKRVLYSEEVKNIDEDNTSLQDIEAKIAEFVEAAKNEDSFENEVLSEALKKTEEDELGDAFDSKLLKAELKAAVKKSKEYNLLKEVSDLFTDKSTVSRRIKASEKKLKEEVQDRISNLTDKEIDDLIYEKWFGGFKDNILNLIKNPLKEDLNALKELKDRYSDTLFDIEEELKEAESELDRLMKELVVL